MENKNEPEKIIIDCAYCGDAPIGHTLSYIESLIASFFDRQMTIIAYLSPRFLKDIANLFPYILFHTFIFLKLAKLSSDIDKAKSFRSRVIWEEAKRRGIDMRQIIFMGRPLDQYEAYINGHNIFFESIPIPYKYLDMRKNWDDKIVLKKELIKYNIPVPKYKKISVLNFISTKSIFDSLDKPIIVKPKNGSRGRHTVTNINTFENFKKALSIVYQISPYVSVEEHIDGYICRATTVVGKLYGFYRACPPEIIGDGTKTILELIKEKNKIQPERVQQIVIGKELLNHISQLGFTLESILAKGFVLRLTHRGGRLFGGQTKEMLDELHPSFIPIIEKAASITGLGVAGFDCIIPDPTKDQSGQKWGIIEVNTLPFIDLHYYALEGKPKNIAGAIWDMWKK